MKARRKDEQYQPPTAGPSVLVVEDEADLQELLRHNLRREGLRVHSAFNGDEALKAVAEHRPDLIVLDLMLPKIDGMEVCRTLRGDPSTSQLPVIILTARTEEADVVAGLELGADDYVTKPFRMGELVARIKTRLRRQGLASAAEQDGDDLCAVRVGPITLDPERHEVSVNGQTLSFTVTEFRILALLMRRPGRVFTRQQIIDAVHDGLAAVSDRSVDVLIVTLRRKLDEHAAWIETVRGVGYRFREPAP